MGTKKLVYFFADGKAEGTGSMKELLGGKGAGLAEMTNLRISVPPGFTITTEACLDYFRLGRTYPAGLWDEILRSLKKLERSTGKQFGDPVNPLLVSVRSGARASMPGMMDTVLNLGLNPKTVQGLARKTQNEAFAWDAYRRFIMMFGHVVMDIAREKFEERLDAQKAELGVSSETNLDPKSLQALVAEFKALVHEETGREFPDEPLEQLKMGINAVFESWYGDRAVTYRRLYQIPDTWGTAVNVVAMVFGNMGHTSGTGVAFTRDPGTGKRVLYGEFLLNAQGEDVVAGIRTPLPVRELRQKLPRAYKELVATQQKLERHYKDMLDLEFTIEEGKLYMLQTRVGKRTGIAAVRIAVELVREGVISKQEAVQRVGPEQLSQYLYPIFNLDEVRNHEPIGKGLPAGPGAASGKIALTPEQAVVMQERGEVAILVRHETSPDDIQGMHAAAGFLTAKGGMTSHAAVVARQMGKVCVAGSESVEVKDGTHLTIGHQPFRAGDHISIDGFTGQVYAGEIPVVESEVIQVVQGKLKPAQSEKYRFFATLLRWADEIRGLRIRANADVPDQALIARGFGAEGIGLCRTEHMFFAQDRISIMQHMILARTREEREQYLMELLPLQKHDFLGLYRAMRGFPVTIRLLDPPLHEFLPKREQLMVDITRMELSQEDPAIIEDKRRLLARVDELHEFNPMLGFRGCRLGILMPEITRMQVRAIIEAACEVAREGKKIIPEIMIPLVGMASEMRAQKQIIQEVADETIRKNGVKLSYLIGTMIEVPRAAVTADQIAREADFFSFGTNDLTQTMYGFSRDDAAKFIGYYINRHDTCPFCKSTQVDWMEKRCRSCRSHISQRPESILSFDPFTALDQEGVGAMIRLAIQHGRRARSDIKLGICGEHGGDPSSIAFFHQLDLDYVSCSPYRLPLARLAAAQATLQAERDAKAGRAGSRSSRPARKKAAKRRPTARTPKSSPSHKRR